jgi:hypothetical protein
MEKQRFTHKEALEPMNGQFLVGVRVVRYGVPGECEEIPTVLLCRVYKGKPEPVARVYRHPSGVVVMCTPPDISLTIKTLTEQVLPIMDRYDKIVAQWQQQNDLTQGEKNKDE